MLIWHYLILKAKMKNCFCLGAKGTKYIVPRKLYWQTWSLLPTMWITYTRAKCMWVYGTPWMRGVLKQLRGHRWLHLTSTIDGLWFCHLQDSKTLPTVSWLNKRDGVVTWGLNSFSFRSSQWKAYENVVTKLIILLLWKLKKERMREKEGEEGSGRKEKRKGEGRKERRKKERKRRQGRKKGRKISCFLVPFKSL